MANEGQLKILRQGVEVWNRWRVKHFRVAIDLKEAAFREADLRWVDLIEADLRRADLRGADLTGAYLMRADLSRANLSGACLRKAHVEQADLRETDLSRANLSGACLRKAYVGQAQLREADLREANLTELDLREADLRGTNLSDLDLSVFNLQGADLRQAVLRGAALQGANLSRVDLRGTSLRETALRKADLRKVDLRGTNLSDLDLSGADLRGANLGKADLRLANLIEANLDGATLTDAALWETQRTAWSIRGIRCKSAYWDEDRQERTSYSLGEFERLYADKTKIVLHYKDGMKLIDIMALPAVIRKIEDTHPGCILRLQSMQESSGGATVTLVVENLADVRAAEIAVIKAELEETGRQLISAERRALEEQVQRTQVEHTLRHLSTELFPRLLESVQPKYSVHIAGGEQTMGDQYVAGQVGAQGRYAHAHDMTFNQLWNQSGPSIDLQALATELTTLRQHLRQEAVEPEHDVAIGAVANAEVAAKEGNGPKTLEWLGKAGKWTLDNAAKIGVGVATAALKTALGL